MAFLGTVNVPNLCPRHAGFMLSTFLLEFSIFDTFLQGFVKHLEKLLVILYLNFIKKNGQRD